MNFHRDFLGIKGYCINGVLLLLLILNGCRCEEPSAAQKVQIGKGLVAALMETPILILGAATAYYEEFGRWPSSICDLEAFEGGQFGDIDWASLRDTIVFEQLTDGGLKIISTDPHFRFTITADVPSDQKK